MLPLLLWQDMTHNNPTQPAVVSCIGVTWKPELLWRECPKYAPHMLRVYEAVTAMGGQNFSRARIQLPPTPHFNEWEALMESSPNMLIVDNLKFRVLCWI